MNTKIMAHVTTGSRDGWGTAAPFLRGSLSFMADAFLEMSMSAFRIWRHAGYDWQGNVNLDIMPGFDDLAIDDMASQAAYWWPIIQAQATAEEERLGIKFDVIKVTNEVGGGGDLPDTDYALQKLVAYEQAILPLAEADNRRILVCNCATDSPQWDDWQAIIAPFVIEAAGRGHVYGRHAYADKIGGLDYLVKDGLPLTGAARPFKELDYFRSLGFRIPTVLGELGFYSFPGTSHFISQIAAYDNLMQSYDELGGGCLFTYGEWGGANIEAASIAMADYLRVRPYEVWFPEFVGPGNPPTEKHKAIIVKLPQNLTAIEWMSAADMSFGFRHTMTASHDDMMTILYGGNDESYVKAAYPERDVEALELVEEAGYRWEPLYAEPEQPDDPFQGMVFGQPLDTSWVTVPGGGFNAPRNYSAFGGKVNDKHEGIDAAPTSGIPAHVLNVWPGVVTAVSYSVGYGNNVTIKHAIDGVVFTTRRAHMASVGVSIGQTLVKGAIIGVCGSTGNSTGNHDHLTMQSPGYGMDGYIVPYVVDPTPYYPDPAIFPPVPPTGETYAIDFLRADPQAWRVIRRADGSGEDAWDLPTSTGFCRVKNSQQGEWYSADGRTRYRDTSPAPDSTGKARLYVQTTGGTSGGKIAPDTAVMGKIYTFYSDVQFYAKSNCQPLSENSGKNVPSTFQLVDVIDNYEFPMTGFVVDRLYITMQTGEKQLYAIKDGRKLGWVGGGASQVGNTWAGELNELYFDRNIPQLEPNKYCS
jgi:hypothetical protein